MRYATTSDGVRIAFAVAGEGPYVVRTPALPFSHCQLDWSQSEFFERLAAVATVVPYDSRGTGLSDREVDDVSLDARVRDIEAVVDNLGLEQFALYGVNFSGTTVVRYATRHPERVSHLILDDAFARTSEYMGTAQNRSTGELIDDWENLTENLAWVMH
jgi:pimeloyl-ACP methyl ester carboxylesterase